MNSDQPQAEPDSIEDLHRELVSHLERLAWAVLRDWSSASDAVQEAFLQLTKCEPPVPPDQVRGWLVKTVQYCALNLRRSGARRTEHELQSHRVREQPEGYDARPRSSHDLEQQEEIERLRLALQALPPEQRQVVELRLGNEKSFAEIANTLNLPLGTVLSRMRLAVEKLRRHFDE
ncbi:MAG: RNA polymerase sigma factor [Pirellulales bacterium]